VIYANVGEADAQSTVWRNCSRARRSLGGVAPGRSPVEGPPRNPDSRSSYSRVPDPGRTLGLAQDARCDAGGILPGIPGGPSPRCTTISGIARTSASVVLKFTMHALR